MLLCWAVPIRKHARDGAAAPAAKHSGLIPCPSAGWVANSSAVAAAQTEKEEQSGKLSEA